VSGPNVLAYDWELSMLKGISEQKKPRRGQKVPSSAATSLTGPTHTNT